jgi:hypothetical protein
MKAWITSKNKLARRFLVPVLAVILTASLGAYEFAKPAHAAAAPAPSPAAPALDDDSIAPLLSLDHAMEALAARVTPACSHKLELSTAWAAA